MADASTPLTQGELFGPAEASTAARPLEPFPWMAGCDWRIVRSPDEFAAWLLAAPSSDPVAVDLECDSLNPRTGSVTGLSAATSPGRACYVPLGHVAGENAVKPLAAFASILKGHTIRGGRLVFHNAKFDTAWLARHGRVEFDSDEVEDTILLAFYRDVDARGIGLKHLAATLLGIEETFEWGDVLKALRVQQLKHAPPESVFWYACQDADLTIRLWHHLQPVREEWSAGPLGHYALGLALVGVLRRMEDRGIAVDSGYAQGLVKKFEEAVKEAEEAFVARCVEAVAATPPGAAVRKYDANALRAILWKKEFGDFLFVGLGLPNVGRKEKSGKWILDKKRWMLKRASVPLVDEYLRLNALVHLKESFVDPLAGHVEPDGRVHASFRQDAMATARISCQQPCLQQLPKHDEQYGPLIRDAFVAVPGHVFASFDYSQLELRVLASEAGVASWRDAFARGEDLHGLTAELMFGEPKAAVLARPGGEAEWKRRRDKAKTINFGVVYGMGDRALAAQARVSEEEARDLRKRHLGSAPELAAWSRGWTAVCRERGHVVTRFGWKRYERGWEEAKRMRAGGVSSGNASYVEAEAERRAVNTRIQGGAAELVRIAMVRVDRAIRERGLRARLLVQIHDDLLFEVPEDRLAEEAPVLAEAMLVRDVTERFGMVPLAVEASVGRRLGQLRPWTFGARVEFEVTGGDRRAM